MSVFPLPKVSNTGITKVNDILMMDGRKTAPPCNPFYALVIPPKISVATIRMVIINFIKTGESGHHSGNRILLRYIVAYCEENCIPYTLQASFTEEGQRTGYHIKRIEYLKPLGLERVV